MEVRELLILELSAGWIVTVAVTVLYGILAPWYKQSAGRYIFGLLMSLSIVLTNSMLGIWLPGLPNRREIGAGLFGLYILAILAMGYGIYKAQILGYRRRKFIMKEKERHREL